MLGDCNRFPIVQDIWTFVPAGAICRVTGGNVPRAALYNVWSWLELRV
jgi:hypothetical protein